MEESRYSDLVILSKLKGEDIMKWKIPKTIRNSLIFGGITMFSSLAATGTPTLGNIYAGLVAGGLTFCIELAHQHGVSMPIKNKGQSSFFI